MVGEGGQLKAGYTLYYACICAAFSVVDRNSCNPQERPKRSLAVVWHFILYLLLMPLSGPTCAIVYLHCL